MTSLDKQTSRSTPIEEEMDLTEEAKARALGHVQD
jgi:hypothetical protein